MSQLRRVRPRRASAYARLVAKRLREGAGGRVARLDPRPYLRGDAGLWLGGLLVGLAAGYAVIALRLAIQSAQWVSFGEFDEAFATAAAALPWLRVWLAPVLGGLVVSLLLWRASKTGALHETRALGVADVIEARAIQAGRIEVRPAVYSAAIATVSLGAGASAGREGPAVHLGGAIAAWMARWIGLSARNNRTILACGAAAAVAASFNAPIAGAVFALEVILGHYALRVIAPVAAASTVGALVARAHFGDQPAFVLPLFADLSLSPADFPAVVLLGAVSALCALAFMRAVLFASTRARKAAEAIGAPLWTLPPVAGAVVGALGLIHPEILGVGYEATAGAIAGAYSLWTLLVLSALKLAATAVTAGGRFGGGVFSPSVFLGATIGAAFGALVQYVPWLETASPAFYAIVGMGALAGAVLGAPLSTTLIVFELTSSYGAGIATLVAVSLATMIVQRIAGASFFQLQIEAHGYVLREGPQRIILQTVRVKDFMTPIDRLKKESAMEGPGLYETDTLGKALGFLEAEGLDGAPVRARGGDEPVVGYIARADALAAYNRRLVEAHAERAS